MKFQTTTAYVIQDGKYVDKYYVTNRPCGNFWTSKRFSTLDEWVAALTAKGAVKS